jgi:osmotically-inducible protein OsmY
MANNLLTRTDGVVQERIQRQLLDNPYHALRSISWNYRQGVLTLHGRLPTYHLKQMAQAAVASVEGVEQVFNCIEVVPAGRETAGV